MSSAAQAYGQTFTFDEDVTLTDVTFLLQTNDDSGVDFTAYVYGWDASSLKTVGPARATVSGAVPNLRDLTPFTIGLGGVAVEAGRYLVVLQARGNGSANWGDTRRDAYGGGAFVLQSNDGDASLLESDGFSPNEFGAANDLAFELRFEPAAVAAVPLPAALPLMLVALAGLGVASRRRR